MIFFYFVVGKVLIFVTRKDNCAELAKNLKENGFTSKSSKNRTKILNKKIIFIFSWSYSWRYATI